MDISFYALFSATCFTLLGLWWNVLQLNTAWVSVDERRAVGGVYLTFLLPALMGLFAQVGGTETPPHLAGQLRRRRDRRVHLDVADPARAAHDQ